MLVISSSSASEASILKYGLTEKSEEELYLNPVATAYRAFKRTSDPLKTPAETGKVPII